VSWGEIDFHRLLNRMVTDLSGPIVLSTNAFFRVAARSLGLIQLRP